MGVKATPEELENVVRRVRGEDYAHLAQKNKAERDAKMQALHGFKAAITANVWRGNNFIYQEYVSSLRAMVPVANTPVENLIDSD